MSDRRTANRMELLALRARLRMGHKGAKTLRGKRSALADEFFRLMRGVLEGRETLDRELAEATLAARLSEAMSGREALASLAIAAAREVPVEIRTRRVWGVPTPELAAPRLVRTPEGRGSSVREWDPGSLETARRHEEALELLLGICSREILLRRLGEEIRETSRRINALEQSLLPRLEHEGRRIRLALEEREREEVVRLKRFKSRRRE